MELLKDYGCTILYHIRKANVVADALSRKSMDSLAHIAVLRRLLIKELYELERNGIRFEISRLGSPLAPIQARSSLTEIVKETQRDDPKLSKIKEDV